MSDTVIKIAQGDSAPQIIRVFKDGERLNITGYTFNFTVKKKVTDTDDDAMIKIDWSSHTDPTQGQTLLDIPPSATKNLEPGKYVFDIQFKNGGNVTTVCFGTLIIIAEVTRR